MTVQEAIGLLENLDGMIEDNHNSDYDSAFRIAIESMKEVEQYRALGTVEELKEAREKQVAKKPIKVKGACYMKDKKGNEHYQTKYLCPACRKQLLYCGYPCKCGQLIDYNNLNKLDWSEEDD